MKNHFLYILFTVLIAGFSLTTFAQAPPNESRACSVTVTLTVADASAPQALDGSITANPAGGTAPYRYVWSKGDTTQARINIGTGTNCVSVYDAFNCFATACGRVSAPGCDSVGVTIGYNGAGPDENSAYVIPQGGTAPYTYVWNTGATDSAIYNLSSGIYCATVTDAIGCSATPCAGESAPPTGIKEEDNLGQIEVYPNPVSDVLTIELEEQENATLTIVTIDGKEVLSHNLTKGRNTIITETLPTGMYMYTVADAVGQRRIRGKVMVSR